MSNYLIGTTKTIDDLFEPLQNETPNPDTNYKNNFGNDFSNSYAPYINGTTKAVITNYIVNDTTNYPLSPLDLNSIFKRKVILPIGTITICASSTIPTDYLLCNGQALSTTNYSDLFNLIGYTYGGSGTTFNIPNFNTNQSMPYYDTNTLSYGSSGGSNNIDITSNNLPLHTHAQSLTLSQHTHNVNTLNSISRFYRDPSYVNEQFGSGNAQRIVNAAQTAWPTQTDGPTSNTINGSSGTNSNTSSVTINVQNSYIGINYIIKCI